MVLGETADRTRSEAWVRYVEKHPEDDFVLYLAAGRLPFSRKMNLKEKMWDDIIAMLVERGYRRIEYGCLQKGEQRLDVVFARENGWGTFEEVLLVVNILRIVPPETIIVFSSKSHLPRCVAIWNMLAPGVSIQAESPEADMSQGLVVNESSKGLQAKVFYRIYVILGEQALWSVSWTKNLVMNVILS